MKRIFTVPVVFGILLLLVGCNGSSNGRVSIALTDSPFDNASAAVVEFTGITFQPDAGAPITYKFYAPQQIDLAQLQNGNRTPLVDSFTLPAGHYQYAELLISATGSGTDSYLTLNDGTQHALVLGPTGTQGLRARYLVGGFDVDADTTRAYTIDFDMRKSVLSPTAPSTDYVLEPRLRMVQDDTVGNIIGTVSSSLIGSGCTPVVYAYDGTVSKPADLDNTAPANTQPVSESPVKLNATTGAYEFTVAYLPAGTYTMALTCDAAADNPAQPDAITFEFTGTAPAILGSTVRISMN
ncbi:MAG TPA: DUF4382 domain-containing protein [Gammaproteobacteria bacterium]